jgi:CheY-like chemotaxis protein
MSVTRELLWAGPFAESAGMPQPLRILLVEDEPTIADTLIYALKTEGFAFEWVSTGEEALEKVFGGAEAFALVVLDVGLPGISGFDVCRKLRTRSQVPVLFLTARQSEIDRVVGLETGDLAQGRRFVPDCKVGGYGAQHLDLGGGRGALSDSVHG